MSERLELDERLRRAARTYRRLGNHTAEGMFLEAADTICELQAENAKLREELADAPKCETCEAMLDCDECLRADCSHKERRRLSAENAKLLELVEDMLDCIQIRAAFSRPPTDEMHEMFYKRARELGVDE